MQNVSTSEKTLRSFPEVREIRDMEKRLWLPGMENHT